MASYEMNAKCDFTPSYHFWGLLLCLWTWVTFVGGIQHSPVDGYSPTSCNFGVLAEDEHMSFYSAIIVEL